MSLPVIILGGGGHAKVLIDTLQIKKVTILGITDSDPLQQGSEIYGFPIIGNDDAILQYPPAKVRLVNGLGSVGSSNRRQELFKYFKGLGYTFIKIIHPSAIIASDVRLSEGVQIMAGTVIQAGSTIGRNTIINTKVSVDHDCHIGAHVHIAPGVTVSGGVQVGEGAHIGPGAIIIQGVKVGKTSVIGAGTLLLKNIPKGVTAIGVPASIRNKLEEGKP